MDEPNLEKALKNNDLNPLQQDLNKIVEKSDKTNNALKSDIEKEDHESSLTLQSFHLFYTLIIIQTILSIILSVFQLFKFRNKLKSYFF